MKLAVITAAALAAMLSMGPACAADGKAVFDKACAGCHKSMSPKLTGDKAKWDEILKKGHPAIIESVLKGKGPMKALGGAANAEDAKAATEYMLTQVKMGQASAADGKAVYEKACAGCHQAMSPKLTGDKAKWDEILKKGHPAMIESVLKGKGTMKALGGAANAEDAKAAFEYMLTQIK